MEQVEEMMRKCAVQSQHLSYIGCNLPKHLPQQPLAAESQAHKERRPSDDAPLGIGGPQQEAGPPSDAGDPEAGTKGDRRKKKVQVPCRWVLERAGNNRLVLGFTLQEAFRVQESHLFLFVLGIIRIAVCKFRASFVFMQFHSSTPCCDPLCILASRGRAVHEATLDRACECRYVSESEYGALSSYMTQRLPLSKVTTHLYSADPLQAHDQADE